MSALIAAALPALLGAACLIGWHWPAGEACGYGADGELEWSDRRCRVCGRRVRAVKSNY